MAVKRCLHIAGILFFSVFFVTVQAAFADDAVELLVCLKPDAHEPVWPAGVEKVRYIRGSRLFRIWVDVLREAEVTAVLETMEEVAFVEKAAEVRVRGQRSEGPRGQRTEVRGQKDPEVGGQRSEGPRGQRSEVRGQKDPEVGGQRTEDRGQRSEVRGQRPDSGNDRAEEAAPMGDMRIAALPGIASVTRWQEQIHASALSELGSGSGVLVAVIDTGIDLNNSDFTSRLWNNLGEIPGDGLDNDGNGFVDDASGWDFGDADNLPQDLNGHGTKVSSVILGVAPSCAILPVKVNQGSLETFSMGALAEGIYYAVSQGATIINISSSAASFSTAVSVAVSDAYHAGALIMAAAGNSGWTPVEFPASLAETIAVGAIDSFSQIAFFSSWGPEVDVTAPGEDVEVTGLGGVTEFVSGTSFSAPVIAGTAAVLKSMNPHLRIETIRRILLQGTVDLGDPGRDVLYGTGAMDGGRIFGLMAPRITLPAYPFQVPAGQEPFSVGAHIPVTDSHTDVYIAIMAGDRLLWLGPDIDWRDSTIEPLSAVARVEIEVQFPDIVLFGAGGVFPALDPRILAPGSYLWVIGLTDVDGRLVGPVTFSEMVIN